MAQDMVRLVERLRERGQRLALAESCTGGLVSARLASLAGVSDVYNGGVVAYANHVKTEVLFVSDSLIRQQGAVSTSVAREMARGVRELLHSDWAASITGIAGPTGGTPQKPVGTVCFAIVGPGVEWSVTKQFDGDRAAIQDQSARFVVEVLELALDGKDQGLDEIFRTSSNV
ncbi:MAG: CinA family protein [Bdellovibrionales bacterium]|jgi:PncC family amidohydrolase|nr:CinA family protein [Bdellovibrionales bacterium]